MTPYSFRELLTLTSLAVLGLARFGYMLVYGYRRQLRSDNK